MNQTEKQLSYPYNLLECVFGEPNFTEAIQCPAELSVSLEYVLLTLTEREQYVLRKRFAEMWSQRAVGAKLGIGGERVRQIENKAIRTLRHPSRLRFLQNGITGEIKRREKALFEKGYSEGSSNAKKDLWEHMKPKSVTALGIGSQAIDTLQKNSIDTIAKLADQSYYWLRAKIGVYESVSIVRTLEMIGCDTWLINEVKSDDIAEEVNKITIARMPIEELDLSPRLYHCLAKKSIKTIQELSAWTCTDLLNIRGLGVKSLDELKEKLRPFGIELKNRSAEL